jgi:hypothetical protein
VLALNPGSALLALNPRSALNSLLAGSPLNSLLAGSARSSNNRITLGTSRPGLSKDCPVTWINVGIIRRIVVGNSNKSAASIKNYVVNFVRLVEPESSTLNEQTGLDIIGKDETADFL